MILDLTVLGLAAALAALIVTVAVLIVRDGGPTAAPYVGRHCEDTVELWRAVLATVVAVVLAAVVVAGYAYYLLSGGAR